MSDPKRERRAALDPPKPWTQPAYPTPAYPKPPLEPTADNRTETATETATREPSAQESSAPAVPREEAQRRVSPRAAAYPTPAYSAADEAPATHTAPQPVPRRETARPVAPVAPVAPVEEHPRRAEPTEPSKRRFRWKPLYTVVCVLIALAVVYVSGALDAQLQQFGIPVFSSLRPAETDAPQPTAAPTTVPTPWRTATATPTATPVPIVPAVGGKSLALVAFTADPATAQAPASITFDLKGSADIQAVRLMTQGNEPLSASVQVAPWEDGRQWRVTIRFDAPYRGDVIAYLRDENGQWTLSPMRCTLDVR